MTNHNYLPFEVTQILPKVNPYKATHCFYMGALTDSVYFISKSELKKSGTYIIVSDAWTIIDALTYLEKQGWIIEVFYYKGKDSIEWAYHSFSWGNQFTQGNYISCIEAYISGIKHCLELINQNKNGNIN